MPIYLVLFTDINITLHNIKDLLLFFLLHNIKDLLLFFLLLHTNSLFIIHIFNFIFSIHV